MRIYVLTLFPEMVEPVLSASIVGKAREKGLVSIEVINFRDWSTSKHGNVDDTPYGGGGGMVLMPEPIFRAVEHLPLTGKKTRIILTCPQGETFTQKKAEELAREEELVIICGHYEGFDERIREHLVTDELSIGDFVLTGGEIASLAIVDSVVRLLPGVLGNERSAEHDSFTTGLLEHPHYTRPAEFRGWKVPDILLSGHHERIAEWRHREALRRTWQRRPDLLRDRSLSEREQAWILEFEQGE